LWRCNVACAALSWTSFQAKAQLPPLICQVFAGRLEVRFLFFDLVADGRDDVRSRRREGRAAAAGSECCEPDAEGEESERA